MPTAVASPASRHRPRAARYDDPEPGRELDRRPDREQHRPATQAQDDEHGEHEVDVPEPELDRDRQECDERERRRAAPARRGTRRRRASRTVHAAVNAERRQDRRDRSEGLGEDRRIPVGVRRDDRRRRVVERLAVDQALRREPVGVLVARDGPAVDRDDDEQRARRSPRARSSSGDGIVIRPTWRGAKRASARDAIIPGPASATWSVRRRPRARPAGRRSARILPSASRRYGSTPTSIDVLMM